jgi:hypothetical protein
MSPAHIDTQPRRIEDALHRTLTDKQTTTKLSKKDIKDLVAKIKEIDFYGLRKEYAPSFKVTDEDSLVLTITQNKKTHEVSVYAYSFLKKDKEVKRFLRVWSEVLTKVPSPNPEQKPKLYES